MIMYPINGLHAVSWQQLGTSIAGYVFKKSANLSRMSSRVKLHRRRALMMLRKRTNSDGVMLTLDDEGWSTVTYHDSCNLL